MAIKISFIVIAFLILLTLYTHLLSIKVVIVVYSQKVISYDSFKHFKLNKQWHHQQQSPFKVNKLANLLKMS